MQGDSGQTSRAERSPCGCVDAVSAVWAQAPGRGGAQLRGGVRAHEAELSPRGRGRQAHRPAGAWGPGRPLPAGHRRPHGQRWVPAWLASNKTCFCVHKVFVNNSNKKRLLRNVQIFSEKFLEIFSLFFMTNFQQTGLRTPHTCFVILLLQGFVWKRCEYLSLWKPGKVIWQVTEIGPGVGILVSVMWKNLTLKRSGGPGMEKMMFQVWPFLKDKGEEKKEKRKEEKQESRGVNNDPCTHFCGLPRCGHQIFP